LAPVTTNDLRNDEQTGKGGIEAWGQVISFLVQEIEGREFESSPSARRSLPSPFCGVAKAPRGSERGGGGAKEESGRAASAQGGVMNGPGRATNVQGVATSAQGVVAFEEGVGTIEEGACTHRPGSIESVQWSLPVEERCRARAYGSFASDPRRAPRTPGVDGALSSHPYENVGRRSEDGVEPCRLVGEPRALVREPGALGRARCAGAGEPGAFGEEPGAPVGEQGAIGGKPGEGGGERCERAASPSPRGTLHNTLVGAHGAEGKLPCAGVARRCAGVATPGEGGQTPCAFVGARCQSVIAARRIRIEAMHACSDAGTKGNGARSGLCDALPVRRDALREVCDSLHARRDAVHTCRRNDPRISGPSRRRRDARLA
jgi:hypothetical protein